MAYKTPAILRDSAVMAIHDCDIVTYDREMLARLAAQIGVVTKALRKRMPRRASASRCGVCRKGCPAQPSASARWSSVTRSTRLGRSRRVRAGHQRSTEAARRRATPRRSAATRNATMLAPYSWSCTTTCCPAAIGTDLPELEQLQRVTLKGALTVVLVGFAAYAMIGSLADVGFDNIANAFEDARWGLVVIALILATDADVDAMLETAALVAQAEIDAARHLRVLSAYNGAFLWAILLLPLGLGMLYLYLYPRTAVTVSKWSIRASLLGIALIVVGSISI